MSQELDYGTKPLKLNAAKVFAKYANDKYDRFKCTSCGGEMIHNSYGGLTCEYCGEDELL